MSMTLETSARFSLEDARQFLYREARYLDDRDWDAWLSLYADGVEFWMPSWDDDDKLIEDPQTEISLIWYGHKGGLEDRVFRIRTERSSATSLPEPRTSHNISNVEILEQSQDADELLEHTKMAMYQDRMFAFTPKGELHQLPKGSTPVDFAYAVHTNLGNQTVGAKVNGRVVPLRTPLENGDQVEILKSDAQEPQPGWLSFAITGKARAAIRRYIRHKQRGETIALGRKIYNEIIGRFPVEVGEKALNGALKRLKLEDEGALMIAIGTNRVTDAEVMEALVPGSSNADKGGRNRTQQTEAVSILGLTPGIAFKLGECCHPVPGDRIVGLRRPGEPIEVHTIDCLALEAGQDADWVDLSWDSKTQGGTARLSVIVKNQPGALATVAHIFATNKANILNLQLVNRDGPFHTDVIDIEVDDTSHLARILSALRAVETVVQAERV